MSRRGCPVAAGNRSLLGRWRDALEEAAEGEGGEGNDECGEEEWLLPDAKIRSAEAGGDGGGGDEVDQRDAGEEGGHETGYSVAEFGETEGKPNGKGDQAEDRRNRVVDHPPRRHRSEREEEHGAGKQNHAVRWVLGGFVAGG